MRDLTPDDVIGIIDRYKDEPVAPLSAFGGNLAPVQSMLVQACDRQLADPGAPERWKAHHKPTEPLPDFEREPRRVWHARRALAERALVDLARFVPDGDARLLQQFLDGEAGRAAPLEEAERDRARSVLARIEYERARARRLNREDRHSADLDPMVILMLVFTLPVVLVSGSIGAWVGDSIGVYVLGDRWLAPLVVAGALVGAVAPVLYFALLGPYRDRQTRKVRERETGEPHEPR